MVPRSLRNVMVTGGAGFIGTNFIRVILANPAFEGRIINVDKVTYAGNPSNLADIAELQKERYRLVRTDICDQAALREVFRRFDIDTVVHFAAETHVDRSIHSPRQFVETNVFGTLNLLEEARSLWRSREDVLFHHVSTDEVFGSLGEEGLFLESSPYAPRSPYSASKAASDHLVRAYHHTYGLPITLSNCSNNYGPYQFPEKMIPLMLLNIVEGKELPVYGQGENVRDWIYVEDHATAIWAIIRSASAGQTYNIGGENQVRNLDLVRRLCEIVSDESGGAAGDYTSLIRFVKDRPGHDKRYALDCSKIKRELGWSQKNSLDKGLHRTVRWYLDHRDWVESVRSGEYRKWIDLNYARRA